MISFILNPILPTTQPGINFWSRFDYWTLTFGIGAAILIWALIYKRYIEQAIFLSMAFYSGLLTQSILGMFYGASGILPSYSLTMIIVTMMMGLIFIKGRD